MSASVHKRWSKPHGHGACPTFFFALCRTASTGGTNTYRDAGYQLAGNISRCFDDDVGTGDAAEFEALVGPPIADTKEFLAWLDKHVPRCMALVPRKRRDVFMHGFMAAVEEGVSIQ